MNQLKQNPGGDGYLEIELGRFLKSHLDCEVSKISFAVFWPHSPCISTVQLWNLQDRKSRAAVRKQTVHLWSRTKL